MGLDPTNAQVDGDIATDLHVPSPPKAMRWRSHPSGIPVSPSSASLNGATGLSCNSSMRIGNFFGGGPGFGSGTRSGSAAAAAAASVGGSAGIAFNVDEYAFASPGVMQSRGKRGRFEPRSGHNPSVNVIVALGEGDPVIRSAPIDEVTGGSSDVVPTITQDAVSATGVDSCADAGAADAVAAAPKPPAQRKIELSLAAQPETDSDDPAAAEGADMPARVAPAAYLTCGEDEAQTSESSEASSGFVAGDAQAAAATLDDDDDDDAHSTMCNPDADDAQPRAGSLSFDDGHGGADMHGNMDLRAPYDTQRRSRGLGQHLSELQGGRAPSQQSPHIVAAVATVAPVDVSFGGEPQYAWRAGGMETRASVGDAAAVPASLYFTPEKEAMYVAPAVAARASPPTVAKDPTVSYESIPLGFGLPPSRQAAMSAAQMLLVASTPAPYQRVASDVDVALDVPITAASSELLDAGSGIIITRDVGRERRASYGYHSTSGGNHCHDYYEYSVESALWAPGPAMPASVLVPTWSPAAAVAGAAPGGGAWLPAPAGGLLPSSLRHVWPGMANTYGAHAVPFAPTQRAAREMAASLAVDSPALHEHPAVAFHSLGGGRPTSIQDLRARTPSPQPRGPEFAPEHFPSSGDRDFHTPVQSWAQGSPIPVPVRMRPGYVSARYSTPEHPGLSSPPAQVRSNALKLDLERAGLGAGQSGSGHGAVRPRSRSVSSQRSESSVMSEVVHGYKLASPTRPGPVPPDHVWTQAPRAKSPATPDGREPFGHCPGLGRGDSGTGGNGDDSDTGGGEWGVRVAGAAGVYGSVHLYTPPTHGRAIGAARAIGGPGLPAKYKLGEGSAERRYGVRMPKTRPLFTTDPPSPGPAAQPV